MKAQACNKRQFQRDCNYYRICALYHRYTYKTKRVYCGSGGDLTDSILSWIQSLHIDFCCHTVLSHLHGRISDTSQKSTSHYFSQKRPQKSCVFLFYEGLYERVQAGCTIVYLHQIYTNVPLKKAHFKVKHKTNRLTYHQRLSLTY